MTDVAKPKSGRDTNPHEVRWFRDNGDGTFGEEFSAENRVWDTLALAWVKETQPGGGAGGGGAATIADGADVAQGTTTDLSTANTVVGLLKAIKAAITGTLTVATHAVTQSGVWTVARSWTLSSATDSVNVGNFPATQPVSAPVGTPVWVRESDGAAAFVGQKAMAASKPIVIASDQSAIPVTGAFFQATQPVSLATNTPDVTDRAARLIGAPTFPTLTKGAQQATGLSVQDLKDSGRVNIALTIEFAFAQTAETLLTVTESRDGAATATFTSKSITNGKRIRFTGGFAIIESLGTGTTVPQRMYLRLRVNPAAATTTASPLQYVWGLGIATGSAAIPVKASTSAPIVIPDGVEYAGSATATYGLTLETPDWVVTTGTGRCKITLFAFEY